MNHDTEQPLAHVDDAILALHEAGAQQAALTLLVESYHTPITTYCIVMLGDREDGLDAAQETLLAACRGLGGFKRRSSLRTWIFSIARNQRRKSLDKRRTRQRSRHEQADIARQAHREPPSGPVPGPEPEQLEQVLQGLHRLDEKDRSCVLLRYHHGLSAAAIAVVEGVSKRTIERRLRRALEHLEEFVKHGT